MQPTIALTIGDFNGIGPEVVLKSIRQIDRKRFHPLLIGNLSLFQYYNDLLKTGLSFFDAGPESEGAASSESIPVLNLKYDSGQKLHPGVPTPASGSHSMKAVDKAIRLCLKKECQAMVTAPISKEAIHMAGFDLPGHTEYLARQTDASETLMILANRSLRVALSTGHIPLKEVPNQVRKEKLIRQIKHLNKSLIEDFGIAKPRIAILGLNPHAGDGGVLGREEIEEIKPAVSKVKERQQLKISGPLPADGFFGSGKWKNYDAVLAIYHDQGLIPFKTLTFGKGVNFTAGLPIIRTSPDHGTAYDIAGKNQASEESMVMAIQLAIEIAERRYQPGHPVH